MHSLDRRSQRRNVIQRRHASSQGSGDAKRDTCCVAYRTSTRTPPPATNLDTTPNHRARNTDSADHIQTRKHNTRMGTANITAQQTPCAFATSSPSALRTSRTTPGMQLIFLLPIVITASKHRGVQSGMGSIAVVPTRRICPNHF